MMTATTTCPRNFYFRRKIFQVIDDTQNINQCSADHNADYLLVKMRKNAIDAIVPTNIAMPPKRGIALVCILRPSFGTSIAPIFGASFMATGVRSSDKRNAMRNVAHNSLYIFLFPYLFSHFFDFQSGFFQNIHRKLIRIPFFYDDSPYSRVDNHFRANHTRLMSNIRIAAFNGMSH